MTNYVIRELVEGRMSLSRTVQIFELPKQEEHGVVLQRYVCHADTEEAHQHMKENGFRLGKRVSKAELLKLAALDNILYDFNHALEMIGKKPIQIATISDVEKLNSLETKLQVIGRVLKE